MLRFRNLLYALLIFCYSITFQKAFAQKAIKLKDVKKLKLIANGPVMGGGAQSFEVLKENESFICYQTYFRGDLFSEDIDTTHKLVKKVSKKYLKNLLQIVNKADTTLNVKKFGINKKQLIKYVDSIGYNNKLPEKQRSAYIKFLQSEDGLKAALRMALKAMGHPDYSYQNILIISNNNDTIKVHANGSNIFYLPQHIGNVINYNPEINNLFDKIVYMNNRDYDKSYFYKSLCKCAYMACFHYNFSFKFFDYAKLDS